MRLLLIVPLVLVSCGPTPATTLAADGGTYVGVVDSRGDFALPPRMPRAGFGVLSDGGADRSFVFVQLSNRHLCPWNAPSPQVDELVTLNATIMQFERTPIGPGTYAVTNVLAELDGGSFFRGPGIVSLSTVRFDGGLSGVSANVLEAASGTITLDSVADDRVTGRLAVQLALEDGGRSSFDAEFDAPVCPAPRVGIGISDAGP